MVGWASQESYAWLCVVYDTRSDSKVVTLTPSCVPQGFPRKVGIGNRARGNCGWFLSFTCFAGRRKGRACAVSNEEGIARTVYNRSIIKPDPNLPGSRVKKSLPISFVRPRAIGFR